MADIYQMAGHLIRRLHQISTSVFQERMKSLGLDLTSVQFAALDMLDRHPGVDQATLAGAIAYDRATIGGVIDRLTARGLVERQISVRDRRARVLTLTDQGRVTLARVKPVVKALQPEILDGLTDGEREQFLRLARKVAVAGNDRSRAPLVDPGS